MVEMTRLARRAHNAAIEHAQWRIQEARRQYLDAIQHLEIQRFRKLDCEQNPLNREADIECYDKFIMAAEEHIVTLKELLRLTQEAYLRLKPYE